MSSLEPAVLPVWTIRRGFSVAPETQPINSQIGATAETISKKAPVAPVVPVERIAFSQKNTQSCSATTDILECPQHPRKLYSWVLHMSRTFVRLEHLDQV